MGVNMKSSKWRASKQFLVLGIIILMIVSHSTGKIFVVSERSNKTIFSINDMPARYVRERYASFGLKGYLVYSNPPSACTKVYPTPFSKSMAYPRSWFLLVQHSLGCNYQTKIENAQNGGYSAIIIHNLGSNDTKEIKAVNPEKLQIFATFVGEYDGLILNNPPYNCPYYIQIRYTGSAMQHNQLSNYFLSLAVLVGISKIL